MGNVANVSHALIIVFGFILVGVKAAGYDIPITDSQLAQLAGGIFTNPKPTDEQLA